MIAHDTLRIHGRRIAAILAFAMPCCVAPASAQSQDKAADGVTFNKQIAPVLWKNCAGCHRPGEIGPFSLLSYEDASKRADFIAEITSQRRMPPWKAEPNFGKFHDERRLSDADIALLAAWAKADAPEGDAKDLPTPPKFAEGWQLGAPDLVLKMETAFSVPASGPDVYRCLVIPIPVEKDTMLSAVEFRPGNRKVVHHAIMFLDAAGQGRKRDGEDGQPGFPSFGGPGIKPTGGLGGWAPGAMPRHLPEGIGRYLKKGSDLVLQVHYHPSGKEETDQSTVGLYFSKKPVKKIVTGIAVAQPILNIPAGEPRVEVSAESEAIPADVHVLGITPHMHNLGREFKVVAVDPTGKKTAPLIWIKDWDFNWQGAYQFARPLRLPKGSKIRLQAVYDNSAANPKNPNSPPKDVTWGEQTSDEMCLCSVQVFTDTVPDLKKVAAMAGHELAAGIDGGVPGQSQVVKNETRGKRQPGGHAATAKSRAKSKLEALAKKKGPSAGEEAPADTPTEAAPAEGEAPAEAVVEQTPAETKKAPEAKFPAEGIPIPENARVLLSRIDKDRNGTISLEEFNALEPDTRKSILQLARPAKPKKAP